MLQTIKNYKRQFWSSNVVETVWVKNHLRMWCQYAGLKTETLFQLRTESKMPRAGVYHRENVRSAYDFLNVVTLYHCKQRLWTWYSYMPGPVYMDVSLIKAMFLLWLTFPLRFNICLFRYRLAGMAKVTTVWLHLTWLKRIKIFSSSKHFAHCLLQFHRPGIGKNQNLSKIPKMHLMPNPSHVM